MELSQILKVNVTKVSSKMVYPMGMDFGYEIVKNMKENLKMVNLMEPENYLKHKITIWGLKVLLKMEKLMAKGTYFIRINFNSRDYIQMVRKMDQVYWQTPKENNFK